jgi:hypothetical protein
MNSGIPCGLRSSRRIVSLLALCLAGCSGAGDAERDAKPVARQQSLPSVAAARGPADKWFVSADSALSSYLASQRYGDTSSAAMAFEDCDGGSENDTELAAVGRVRIVGHGPASADTMPDGRVAFGATYHIELVTVAHFVPTWTLIGRATSVQAANTDLYVAIVGVRVDTMDINIAETGGGKNRWAVCDLMHHTDEFTPYWDFLNRPTFEIGHIKWQPATSSWPDISRLADSVARAP